MDEDLLFRAFMAGFDCSSEGFNGEYVGPQYRDPGVLEDYLRREYFMGWLADRRHERAQEYDVARMRALTRSVTARNARIHPDGEPRPS